MKTPIKYLLWLALAAALVTCKPEKIEPDPLTDGKPRIISMIFPGILKENVVINQNELLITIKVPSVILEDMEPTVEITDNAHPLLDNFESIFLIKYDNKISLAYKKNYGDYDDVNDVAVTYKVNLVPSGQFEVSVMKSPIEYILYDDPSPVFLVPIVNIYGNMLPKTIELIHRNTKEKILVDSNRIYRGIRQIANNLAVYMDGRKDLLPGTYNIDLKMADGKTLRVPQPLILVKGPAAFTSYTLKTFFGQDATVNSTFFIEGYNFFDGDIALELTDRNGVMTPLSNLTFEPYGLRLGITLPKTVVPGQYVMRLYQFGKDVGRCFRLNVRNGETPEARIGTIGGDAMPCSLQEPIRIERGKSVSITYGLPQSLPNHPRIKLTPANDPSKTFYGSVAPIILQPNPLGPGKLTIAGEVPAGLYTAVLQYLDADGKIVAETEPYAQLLEVY